MPLKHLTDLAKRPAGTLPSGGKYTARAAGVSRRPAMDHCPVETTLSRSIVPFTAAAARRSAATPPRWLQTRCDHSQTPETVLCISAPPSVSRSTISLMAALTICGPPRWNCYCPPSSPLRPRALGGASGRAVLAYRRRRSLLPAIAVDETKTGFEKCKPFCQSAVPMRMRQRERSAR